MFEILRSSAFIYKYYPTNTLGDNLSTSSGTWVVVKSKREVPRGVRKSTFFGIHIQILPEKYPRGQLVRQQGHMGSGIKAKRSTEGCSKFYVLRHSYTNTTRQVPSGQLVHQQWHMGSGKKQKRSTEGVRNSTFFGIHIQILPNKYPRGQLVHQQWHMGSGKKQKRSTEGCSKFYVLRHSYTNTTRQVPSGSTCPPAVAHG